jgi:hypothetical protein
MTRTILIVGGLPTTCIADAVLGQLNQRTAQDGTVWEWAKADAPHYRLPTPWHPLANAIASGRDKTTILVKLRRLFKQDTNRLLKQRKDPPEVPGTVTNPEELVAWLLSPACGLVPAREWMAKAPEAAFFAILTKLLKNKSWANGPQNHNFTQEADLLGQAPVNVHSEIRDEANGLLDKMSNVILLTKGGSHTKKEWAILLPRRPAVMDSYLQRSLTPFENEAGMESLLAYIRNGKGREFRLDNLPGVERAREVCRSERPGAGKSN